jgi:hypothetical protein
MGSVSALPAVPTEERRRQRDRRRGSRSAITGRRLSDLEPDALIPLSDLRERWAVSRSTFDKWIAAGVLPIYNLEGIQRVRAEDAIAFLDRCRRRPDEMP